jgi:hypothetical protein
MTETRQKNHKGSLPHNWKNRKPSSNLVKMDNNVVFKSKHGNFFKKEDVEDDYYVFEVRDQQQILITKDQLLPEKAVSPILNIL